MTSEPAAALLGHPLGVLLVALTDIRPMPTLLRLSLPLSTDFGLQDAVGGQTDRIFDPLGFEELVDFRIRKAGVGAKIKARDFATIPRHDGLQHRVPPIGAMDVPRTQRASFQITELIEQEQRMITGTGISARSRRCSPARHVSG
jgi:hypothetical protein